MITTKEFHEKFEFVVNMKAAKMLSEKSAMHPESKGAEGPARRGW